MPRPLPDRNKRRRMFLRALATGSPVAQACAHARLGWSTVYEWRQQDAKFRDAWTAAARSGAEALAARFDSELMRRAVDGFAEPVFHKGEIVGERTRYSDPLLMFGIRDLRLRQQAAGGGHVAHTPRVTVIIDPIKDDDDE